MACADDDLADFSYGQRPYFAEVAVHFHDVFELVAVPVFDESVFTRGEEVVGVTFECDLHDAVLVGEEALVAITKIETPDLDVLVCGTGCDEFTV